MLLFTHNFVQAVQADILGGNISLKEAIRMGRHDNRHKKPFFRGSYQPWKGKKGSKK